jgi:hypothetical protein
MKLATACGFRTHGDANEIDPRWWALFEGATGRCEIGHRTFTGKKDGKEREVNEIVDFLPPEGSASAAEDSGLQRDDSAGTESAGAFDNLPF